MNITEYLMVRENRLMAAWCGLLLAFFAFMAFGRPMDMLSGLWVGLLSMSVMPTDIKKLGPEDRDWSDLLELAKSVRK